MDRRHGPTRGARITLRRLIYLALLLGALRFPLAYAQTPSALQEWQYSGGIILQHLFQPNLPDWQYVAGLATAVQPVYDGAGASRVRVGPVVNIRYKNIAFLSTGEGLGYNFLRGRYYRVGVALGWDLGRRVPDDYPNLHGMGDLSVAPFVKLFGTYVISKDFPMVIQIDARHLMGGASGDMGDVEAYMPLPGSSRSFFMFAGPSLTWATRRHLQRVFGVTETQSLASGHPVFDVHGGTNSVGLGFSATRLITKNWLLNADAGINWLQGSAADSPITQSRVQRALAISIDYHW